MTAGSIDLNSKDSLPDLASPAAVPGLSGEGRSATRHLGHSTYPRGLASRCLCRARLCPRAGPALADGSAAAAWHRTLCRMGRQVRASPAMCWRGSSTPPAPRGAISRCSTTTPGRCSKPMRAASTPSSRCGRWPAEYAILGARPAAVGAVAFHRGDAPDRLPDGLGVVEAVARGGVADRRRRPDCKIAVRRRRRRHAVHSARR